MPRKTFRIAKTAFKLFSYACGSLTLYAIVTDPDGAKDLIMDTANKSNSK